MLHFVHFLGAWWSNDSVTELFWQQNEHKKIRSWAAEWAQENNARTAPSHCHCHFQEGLHHLHVLNITKVYWYDVAVASDVTEVSVYESTAMDSEAVAAREQYVLVWLRCVSEDFWNCQVDPCSGCLHAVPLCLALPALAGVSLLMP